MQGKHARKSDIQPPMQNNKDMRKCDPRRKTARKKKDPTNSALDVETQKEEAKNPQADKPKNINW